MKEIKLGRSGCSPLWWTMTTSGLPLQCNGGWRAASSDSKFPEEPSQADDLRVLCGTNQHQFRHFHSLS